MLSPSSLRGLLLISMEYLNVNEMMKPLKGCYVAMVSEMPPSQVRNCRHNLSIVQEKIDKVPCTGTGHVILCTVIEDVNFIIRYYGDVLYGLIFV